jgi:hypothetical protein
MSNIFGNLTPVPATPQPSSSEQLGTFTRAIVVEMTGNPLRRAFDCLVSLAIHIAVLAVLSAMPLLFVEDLHAFDFSRIVWTVRAPHFASPGNRSNRVPGFALAIPKWEALVPRLSVPILKRKEISLLAGEPLPPSDLAASPVSSGFTDPLASNFTPSLLPVASASETGIRPVLPGGHLTLPRLVHGLSLVYPEAARQFHLLGKVVVTAIIDEAGHVKDVRLVSGPGLLAVDAIDAVAHEEFVPALLNGEPTPCELIVEVNFRSLDGIPAP